MSYLIKEVKRRMPEIKELIRKGIIRSSDFEYDIYNSYEIIS